jgi:hypothetical protein
MQIAESRAVRICDVAFTPAAGVIPANAPALVVTDSLVSGANVKEIRAREGAGPDWDDGVIKLLPDDSSAPLQRKTTLILAPTNGWVVGKSYQVNLLLDCNGDVKEQPAQKTFQIQERTPLPTHVGELYFERSASEGFAGVTLSISPTPEMLAWAPLAMWTVEVDGKQTVTFPYGERGPNPLSLVLESRVATCPLNFTSDVIKTAHVELRAHIAGTDPKTDPTPAVVDTPFVTCRVDPRLKPRENQPQGNVKGEVSALGCAMTPASTSSSSIVVALVVLLVLRVCKRFHITHQ